MSGSILEIEGLRAAVGDKEIITGLDLTVRSGEVHAIMGPNGSGKSTLSHVLMGRPGYELLGGSVRLDGTELLDLPTWQRAQAGLFLALQYPTEVPGVRVRDLFEESFAAAGRDQSQIRHWSGPRPRPSASTSASSTGRSTSICRVARRSATRPCNWVCSLRASRSSTSSIRVSTSTRLRMCAQRIERATEETALGVIAITHYSRLLSELRPDVVHVFAGGTIVESGGPELADRLEDEGYGAWTAGDADDAAPVDDDPFADPFA